MSSPLKCHDFSDKDDTDGNVAKKPKMTSVRKKPAERNKQKCVDVSESLCQERRSDSSKNFKKDKGRKSKPSTDKSDERKQSTEADKTLTETKTHFFPDTVNSSSYLSSAAEFGDTAFELSKERSTPSQKSKQRTPRAAKLSLPSLVGSFTPSGDSKSAASASADGEGDVFEDYFSPANSRPNSKRPFLPNLPVGRDIVVPFELGSVPKKRKQRRRESTGLETTSKKKKLKESESGRNHSQQSDAGGELQSQDVKLTLDHPSTNVTLVAKRRRQSTLPSLNIGTLSDAGKPRRASTSSLSTVFAEATTTSLPKKNSDSTVLSHTSESE